MPKMFIWKKIFEDHEKSQKESLQCFSFTESYTEKTYST